MNYDLIHFKPVGICTVILKSLILKDYCKKNNLSLLTYIKEEDKVILDLLTLPFDIKTTEFEISNGKETKAIKDLKVKKYFSSWDIDIFDDSMLDTFEHSGRTTVVSDFVLNRHADKLDKISFPVVKKDKTKTLFKKEESVLAFNLKNPTDEKIIYDLWEYWVDSAKSYTGIKDVYFVSGNKKMLSHFNSKYGGAHMYLHKKYNPAKDSKRSEFTRGDCKSVISDCVNCSLISFWDLKKLSYHFPVTADYTNVWFIKTQEEDSFDLMVKYFKDNLIIL